MLPWSSVTITPLSCQRIEGVVVMVVSWGVLAAFKGWYLFICLSCLGFNVLLISKSELLLVHHESE